MNRKGIILAGGSGTRLQPATIGVCKQLLLVKMDYRQIGMMTKAYWDFWRSA